MGGCYKNVFWIFFKWQTCCFDIEKLPKNPTGIFRFFYVTALFCVFIQHLHLKYFLMSRKDEVITQGLAVPWKANIILLH